MASIRVYPVEAEDYTGGGLGVVELLEGTVTEQAGGQYEISITAPMDNGGQWRRLAEGRVIRAAVPARTTPELELVKEPTVARKIYRVKSGHWSWRSIRQGPGQYSPILDRLQVGEEIVVTGSPIGGEWYPATSPRGISGYAAGPYLTFVRDIPASGGGGGVIPERAIKEQLFRLYSVEQEEDGTQVRAQGRHISYDHLFNPVASYKTDRDQSAATVAAGLLGAREDKTLPLRILCGVKDKIPPTDFSRRNLVSCLLDEEIGLARQARCMVVRDNYDIFLAPPVTTWRGYTIRHGKNLMGVTLRVDDSGVYTRLIPVGQNEKGDPVYMSGRKKDSPRLKDYPFPRIKLWEISGAKEGTKKEDGSKKTLDEVRKELTKAAEDALAQGIDQPQVEMDISFTDLAGTAEGAAFAPLQRLCLYDMVRVVDATRGLDATAMLVGYTYNLVTRMYDGIELGDPFAKQLDAVSGTQITGGTITGGKLSMGAVGTGNLQDAIITSAKIGSAAIQAAHIGNAQVGRAAIAEAAIGTAQIEDASIDRAKLKDAVIGSAQIEDASITRAKIKDAAIGSAQIEDASITRAKIASAAIGSAQIEDASIDRAKIKAAAIGSAQIEDASITSAKIAEAGIEIAKIQNLTAEVAKLVKASIKDATIDSAQIDDLAAVVAKLIHAEVKTGRFELAEVKNLLAEALVLENGTAKSMYITNLAVTSANLLSAMLGKLVLKGEDGKYYQIMIGADGTIQTQEVQPTQGEIDAGQTAGGLGIVETGENLGILSGQSVHAQEAVLGRITAKSLAVGKLTAGEAMIASATIPTLYATSIQAIGNSLDLSANESITLMVGKKADAADLQSNVQALEGLIGAASGQVEALEAALEGKADADAVVALSSRLEQNADSITAVISQVAQLEGGQAAADKVLAEYQLLFRIDAQGVTIGKSTSPFEVRIDDQRMSFREHGQEIAYISNRVLHIREAEIEERLTIGGYGFQRMEDRSLGLLVE